MIKEKRLQVFIEGANRYFKEVNKVDVEIGTPYLVENQVPMAHDFTGIIGISGPYMGSVYFTAPKVLLSYLLISIGEKDNSEDNMMDLVGEIANTIAGNARTEYGSEFMISVPVIVRGAPDEIYLPRNTRSFLIPLTWKKYDAAIVICLHNEKQALRSRDKENRKGAVSDVLFK